MIGARIEVVESGKLDEWTEGGYNHRIVSFKRLPLSTKKGGGIIHVDRTRGCIRKLREEGADGTVKGGSDGVRSGSSSSRSTSQKRGHGGIRGRQLMTGKRRRSHLPFMLSWPLEDVDENRRPVPLLAKSKLMDPRVGIWDQVGR